ncbi:hypothetical protein GCM10022297_14070 [Lactobacillus hamsteri]|uniref:Uncharacterized protein n=1 Tax=Lactobacillus hamsteri DSM 5661 = JCM 6256 TaxID=1423754 RepID=A0A0R1YCT8_9LACO|nr:hypothetical protein [Lactobacillus hamsteri]KRM40189.1 hypothetical protein FC39_GL000803 [Lactobacillus hamsteri DSM 5661 = JCM 6256]
MKKLTGFTILESLITLIITCSLLMIGTTKLKDYQSEIRLNNAMRQVVATIEQAGRVSVIKQRKMTGRYDSKTLAVQFAGDKFITMHLEPGIESRRWEYFKISHTGMMKPITIILANGNHMKKARIQMAWGRIIYEE